MTELHQILRRDNLFAHLYLSAAEFYREMPEEDRIHLRMLLVDTNRHGTERTVNVDEGVGGYRPANIAPDERSALEQIHPGRLQVETAAGSRLVAQVICSLVLLFITVYIYSFTLTLGQMSCQLEDMMLCFMGGRVLAKLSCLGGRETQILSSFRFCSLEDNMDLVRLHLKVVK